MFRLFVNSRFSFSLPPPPLFFFSWSLLWHWKREGCSSPIGAELSVAAQHGRAQARESEIFGRLTTSVACRGIEGERAWWACYYWRIYFCDDRTGRTRDLTLSLSAFFVSPSALSFFLGASLGRLLPSRGLYSAVIFRVIQCPCHGPP